MAATPEPAPTRRRSHEDSKRHCARLPQSQDGRPRLDSQTFAQAVDVDAETVQEWRGGAQPVPVTRVSEALHRLDELIEHCANELATREDEPVIYYYASAETWRKRYPTKSALVTVTMWQRIVERAHSRNPDKEVQIIP